MSENKTGCTCTHAGFCHRHNVRKTEHWFKLCQTNEKYFTAWEDGIGPGQNIKHDNFLVTTKRYLSAIDRWIAAGKPIRTDEEVLDIFNKHCLPCKFYDGGRCIKCGCHIRSVENEASSLVKIISDYIGGRAALAMVNKIRMETECCPIGLWGIQTNKPLWISSEQRMKDVQDLFGIIPGSITGVAGIPRSGMTPASMIAEALHLHLYSIHQDTGLVKIPCGWRMNNARSDDGILLVVDDTIASGESLKAIKPILEKIDRRHYICVIYCSPAHVNDVHLYSKILHLPHYLEWNFFNSIHSSNLAVDLDGILVDEDNPAHGIKYKPQKYPLKLIITGRLEKHRDGTIKWLTRNNIEYERLEMWQGEDEVRWVNHACAKWKGQVYRDSNCNIYVESCPIQAKVIAEISGKRVICPKTSEVHN